MLGELVEAGGPTAVSPRFAKAKKEVLTRARPREVAKGAFKEVILDC